MRYKRPDEKNALSIIEAAERKMRYTLTLDVNEDSASTIAGNIYECFRMLGDALFVKMGVSDAKHKEAIDELMTLDVDTQRPIAAIANLRHLRHNINYYGYQPSLAEVEDARDVARKCFGKLVERVRG